MVGDCSTAVVSIAIAISASSAATTSANHHRRGGLPAASAGIASPGTWQDEGGNPQSLRPGERDHSRDVRPARWFRTRGRLLRDNLNDLCPIRGFSRSVGIPVVDVCEVRMAQENAAHNEMPASGLLLGVETLTAAVDRGKANGAGADNDGND